MLSFLRLMDSPLQFINHFFRKWAFTLSILAAVAVGITFPGWFIGVGDFKFTSLFVPILQVIMFCMGTTLSMGDFARVFRMPAGVGVGRLNMPSASIGRTDLPDDRSRSRHAKLRDGVRGRGFVRESGHLRTRSHRIRTHHDYNCISHRQLVAHPSGKTTFSR